MTYKFQYSDAGDRQSIIDANNDKILVEEQNLFEGNFLVFSDAPLPIQIIYTSSSSEFEKMSNDNLILMDVLAIMYEDMLAKGTV